MSSINSFFCSIGSAVVQEVISLSKKLYRSIGTAVVQKILMKSTLPCTDYKGLSLVLLFNCPLKEETRRSAFAKVGKHSLSVASALQLQTARNEHDSSKWPSFLDSAGFVSFRELAVVLLPGLNREHRTANILVCQLILCTRCERLPVGKVFHCKRDESGSLIGFRRGFAMVSAHNVHSNVFSNLDRRYTLTVDDLTKVAVHVPSILADFDISRGKYFRKILE